ncbi:DNA-binding protein WhiA [Ferroacidibacillus organovorans]|uniref:Probable cell division protein WhiA n=1 Tax=Ferroacidibacillus organovorans TaxID=1765683 RepID=A0A101XQ08_9BACL|nr:DNA-binding protein WhiA [Ferroacidibacillus organovorans]KUO95462.1 sporulation regulator WhiA [Ferroacidibacillus organovorans]
MSFAARTKKELTHIVTKPCCERAELTALIQQCGAIREGAMLDLSTENAAIARRIYSLLKTHTSVALEVIVQKKMRLKKNNVYIVRIRRDRIAVLTSLGLAEDTLQTTIPPSAIARDCCKRAYLRGAFMASGSVNDPDSNSYHLEVAAHTERQAHAILELMNSYHFHAKTAARKKEFLVYIKEGEKIVEFLGLIGAHQALLHFEDVRVVKGMRNQVNRLVNCETANLNKTIMAAVRQLENIRLIEEERGLHTLTPKLRVVAEMRLRHPEITLLELAELLPERVSKSGLNHRLRKLDEIAQRIRAECGISDNDRFAHSHTATDLV